MVFRMLQCDNFVLGCGLVNFLKRLQYWYFFLSDTSVDGPQNGASPQPWDIKVKAPHMFQEDTKKFRVPHTSSVKVIRLGGKNFIK